MTVNPRAAFAAIAIAIAFVAFARDGRGVRASAMAAASPSPTATEMPTLFILKVTRDPSAPADAKPSLQNVLSDYSTPAPEISADSLETEGAKIATPHGVTMILGSAGGGTITIGPDSQALVAVVDGPQVRVVPQRGSVGIDDPKGRFRVFGREFWIEAAPASYVIDVSADDVTIACTSGPMRTRHVIISPDVLAAKDKPVLETIASEDRLGPAQSATYRFGEVRDLRADYERLAAAGPQVADAAQIDLAMLNYAPDGLPYDAPKPRTTAALAALAGPASRKDPAAMADLDAVSSLAGSSDNQKLAYEAGDAGDVAALYNGGLEDSENGEAANLALEAAAHLAAADRAIGFRDIFVHPGGFAADEEGAFPWLVRAVAEGSENARSELASLYDGRGNPAAATTLYQSLAKLGDADAEAEMGDRYFYGKAVPIDTRQALVWYEKAAAQGNARGELRAAFQYAAGVGTPPDYAKARSYYEALTAAADVGGEIGLGRLYADGRGVEQDSAKALHLFRMAITKEARDENCIDKDSPSPNCSGEYHPAAIEFPDPAPEPILWEATSQIPPLEERGKGLPVDLPTAFVWTLITDTLRTHAPRQFNGTVRLSEDDLALERRLTAAQRRAAFAEAKAWLDSYPNYRSLWTPAP